MTTAATNTMAEPEIRPSTTVNVTFMGELPSLLGKREQLVSLPQDATVADLMRSLVATFGQVFEERVFSGLGKLHHTVVVFVDGQSLGRRNLLQARLGAGAVEVVLLPMFAGG